MFYASDILAMKNNTDISLLYFISTTNRITKKDLKRLNIPSLLLSLTEQPFALRLYSYLVVGIIRVYLYQLKVYEMEIQTLLSSLQVKKITKRRMKEASDRILLRDMSLLVDEPITSEVEDLEDVNYCDEVDHPRVKKRLILDSYTEYPTPTKFCTNFYKKKFPSCPPSSTYEVLELIKSFDLQEIHLSFDYEPVEKMRGSSGLNYSTTVVEEIPFDVHRMTEGGRLSRAMNFYLLLEKCSKGEIQVYQKEPYSEIQII